jgi:putative protease
MLVNRPAPPPLPELLAPGGAWDSVRAAVAGGADAVYFGVESFNARRRAANFSSAELPELVAWLHDHNVRGYLALNTLLFPGELAAAADIASAAVRAGVDAIIIQDLGLLALLRRLAPGVPVHASTQLTQTEPAGLEWLRARGVQRAILARELSLAELETLAAGTALELEVFVHGALCVAYSGQCLASEALWGRSGNRGECGQACRLPYTAVVDGRPRGPAAPPATALPAAWHPLSPHDLAAVEFVPALVRLGVAALKIEGRLKGPHYVAAVVRLYRAALDAAARGEGFTVTDEHRAALAQAFSRGFTTGFLGGIDHQRFIAGRSPKARGLRLGTVAAQAGGGLVVALDPTCPGTVRPGDGIGFEDGRGEPYERGGRVRAVQPGRAAGELVLHFAGEDLDPRDVAPGSVAWKTDDPQLRRALERTYSRVAVVRRAPLDIEVRAVCGAPLGLRARDAAGHEVEVTSAAPLQRAVRQPLDAELLRAQFGRLGETPFALRAVALHGAAPGTPPEPVLAPKSVLNELRRRAVAGLREQRAAAAACAVREPGALAGLRAEADALRSAGADLADAAPRLGVLVRAEFQCPAVHRHRAAVSEIVLDLPPNAAEQSTLAAARAAGLRVVLATPRVVHPHEYGRLRQLAGLGPDAVLVRNLAAMRFLQAEFPHLPLDGDASLNATNELAAAELWRAGLRDLTAAHDLDAVQLGDLLRRVPAGRCTVVLHQHVPLFHTRHCLYAATLSDGPRCGACGWPCRGHTLALRDRLGFDHPVRVDASGCNTVYNARVQSAAECLHGLRAAGARSFRIELLDESAAQAAVLLSGYAALLRGELDARTLLARLRDFYPAGIYAGTLGN